MVIEYIDELGKVMEFPDEGTEIAYVDGHLLFTVYGEERSIKCDALIAIYES